MLARANRIAAIVVALGIGGIAVAQPEPTLHQVYEAALSGRVGDAQRMMGQVLHDYPDSAKAHYVAAEIDAKAGDLPVARQELAQAETLAPGLPFAKPEAVRALRRELAGTTVQPPQPAPGAGSAPLPWGLIALLMAGVGIAWALLRRRPVQPAAIVPGALAGPGSPGYGAVPAYAAPAGGGLLGNLATGLAVGAGVAAGEELVRHMIEPGHAATREPSLDAAAGLASDSDFGGADFGVNDPGSWDDGAVGGDDWS